MKTKTMTYVAYLVSALGILLHVYLTYFQTERGSVYNLIVPAMNAIPYLACIIVIMMSARPILPLCAGILLLLSDAYQFHDYLFSPGAYRFPVIESYLIMLKMAVILPAGCLSGLWLDGFAKRCAAKSPQ